MTDDSGGGRSRRTVLRVAGAGAAAGVAGCLASAPDSETCVPSVETARDCASYPDDVSLFQQNLKRQGYYPDQTVPESVTVDWSFEANVVGHTAAKSTPVPTLDGDIVFADDSGVVQVRAPDGTQHWRVQTEATELGFHGSPGVVGNRAYVGGYDGAVYAFNVETGDRLWTATAGDLGGTLAVGSSPAFYDGTLYFIVEYGSPSSGALWALDPVDGEPQWSDDRVWGQSHPSPTVDRDVGRIVAGSNDGTVYGWSFPDGEFQWEYQAGPDGGPTGRTKAGGEFSLGAQVKGTVAACDGRGYVGSWDQHLHCIDLTDGSGVWTFDTGRSNMSNPAVDPDEGIVYTGSDSGHVWALDAESGEQLWRADVGGRVVGALTLTEETVLAGSYDTHLYALDAATGDRRWRVENRGRVTSGALPLDGRIYYAERGVFSNYYSDSETVLEQPGYAYCLAPDG
jgi:outer membrane protein assembly factor BamB